jgi:hypothetical protein
MKKLTKEQVEFIDKALFEALAKQCGARWLDEHDNLELIMDTITLTLGELSEEETT